MILAETVRVVQARETRMDSHYKYFHFRNYPKNYPQKKFCMTSNVKPHTHRKKIPKFSAVPGASAELSSAWFQGWKHCDSGANADKLIVT